MKKKIITFLVSMAFGCLAFSQTAHAQADKRIRIIPPFPPFPPPWIEVRVPEVGPMLTREMSAIAKVNGLHTVVVTSLVFYNSNARLL